MFKFKKKEEIESDRAKFANHICKMLWDKHDGNIKKCLNELPEIRGYFEEHVRNIYEHIDSKIPMFAYYELIRDGADNYGMTNSEWSDAKIAALLACEDYYND